MPPRFTKVVDRDRYSHEPPIAIGLASRPTSDWLFVPETVGHRLLTLGRAHGLHVLRRLLEPCAENRPSAERCRSLLDELKWLPTVAEDP
jgi:hypothetical protein